MVDEAMEDSEVNVNVEIEVEVDMDIEADIGKEDEEAREGECRRSFSFALRESNASCLA